MPCHMCTSATTFHCNFKLQDTRAAAHVATGVTRASQAASHDTRHALHVLLSGKQRIVKRELVRDRAAAASGGRWRGRGGERARGAACMMSGVATCTVVSIS